MNNALISKSRSRYHERLTKEGVLSLSPEGIASNSDSGNYPSIQLGRSVALQLGASVCGKMKGQSAGRLFEEITAEFLSSVFPRLQHLRPGNWQILNLGNQNSMKTWDFAQYEHLAYLSQIVQENKKLSAMLGNDYMIAPDIVVYRELCDDPEINQNGVFVDDSVCLKADLRKKNGGNPILHASVSTKWTMRSDRAQNSRTEALNLIRNRKGRVPHIVVVTGEPTPSRIASLALGTGDIDCVYHFALYELLKAVKEYDAKGKEDLEETLTALVEGKRLKDISDLILDLTC